MVGVNISSKEKYLDSWTLIALIAIVFLGDISILATPFLHGTYEDLGYTWFIDIWGFGGWVNYNRVDNDMTTTGMFSDLTGFSVVIILFLFISLIVITVSVFFLGRNKWRSNTLQKSAGGSISFFSLMGLMAVILFAVYHNNNSETHMKYSGGFYIAIIFYSFVFFAGLKNIIFPNQLRKPKITSPPTQEKLISEEVKDEKRSKLFDYIEKIDDSAKDDL